VRVRGKGGRPVSFYVPLAATGATPTSSPTICGVACGLSAMTSPTSCELLDCLMERHVRNRRTSSRAGTTDPVAWTSTTCALAVRSLSHCTGLKNLFDSGEDEIPTAGMIRRIFQNASSPSMYLRLSEHFDLPRCHDGGERSARAVLQSLEADLCPHLYLDVATRLFGSKCRKDVEF